jgi:hypothetical protein
MTCPDYWTSTARSSPRDAAELRYKGPSRRRDACLRGRVQMTRDLVQRGGAVVFRAARLTRQ